MPPKTWEEERAAVAAELATKPVVSRIQLGPSAEFVRDYIRTNQKAFGEILCSDRITPGWIAANADKDIFMLWAMIDGKAKPVAFAEAGFDESTRSYHVDTICARSGGRGWGSQVLKSVESYAFKAKNAQAVTLDAISSALGFYEKQGQTAAPDVSPEAFTEVKKVIQLKAAADEYNTLRKKLGVLADSIPMMKAKGAGRKKTLRKTRRRTKSRR